MTFTINVALETKCKRKLDKLLFEEQNRKKQRLSYSQVIEWLITEYEQRRTTHE